MGRVVVFLVLAIVVVAVLSIVFYYYSLGGTGEDTGGVGKRVVVYAYPDAITGVDPSYEYDTGLVVLGLVYEPLLYYNPLTKEFTPCLAEKWESSSNNTVWTFYLRRDAVFHDGTPVTAEAVKLSILRSKAFGSEAAGWIWENLVEIRVIDDYTVQFILDKPTRLDLIASSAYGAYIYSPKFLDVIGVSDYSNVSIDQLTSEEIIKWFNKGNDLGSGPYKIVYYDPENEVRLEKFSDWWGWKLVDNPYAPDVIVIKIVTDPLSQLNGLEAGSIDIASDLPLGEIARLKQSGYNVIEMPTYHNFVLQINTRRFPTNNTLFRKALAHLIPWDRIKDTVLHGYGRIASGIIPYGYPGHLDNLTYSYDLEKARELIRMAGLEGKVKELEIVITVDYEQEENFAQLLKSELAKLGIELKITAVPWEQVVEYGKAVWSDPEKAPHLIINDWWPTYPTPYDYLYNLLSIEVPGWNWAGYNNSLYEELIDKAFKLEGVDYNESLRLYTMAQNIVYDEAPAIGLWDEVKPLATSSRVHIPEKAINPLYMFVIFFQYVEVRG